jgi:hypothetical protein
MQMARYAVFVLAVLCYVAFSVGVHVLLIRYAVQSWRRLNPQLTFRAQLPDLLRSLPRYLLGWAALVGGMWMPVPYFVAVGPSDNPWFEWSLGIFAFIPMLPVLPGVLLLEPLFLLRQVGIDFWSEWYITIPVIIIGTVLSAILILLLISFIEWLILRTRHGRSRVEIIRNQT